jgi:dTDP-4-dehydrorhamnose 3,5-epimerase-like enzyme
MSESIVKLVNIPQYGDERGSLSVAEYNKVIPFLVRRIYWIYGTKKGVSRGFHAHKKLHQLCVCVSGSARLVLFDGVVQEEVVLNNPSKGLLIGPESLA